MPEFPPPPGSSAGNTLDSLTTNDTFITWFDRTNKLIEAVNPLAIYGATTYGSGTSYEGVTIAFNNETGVHKFGFSPPAVIYGNTEFVGGITFSGVYVSFNGGTVDFHTSNLYGKVVTSVNGQTGDVTVSGGAGNLPGASTGHILVYNEDGSTYQAQPFFSGVTFDVIAATEGGGLVLGATLTDAGDSLQKGYVQLVTAGGSAGILFRDSSYSGANLRERGSNVHFGKNSSSNNYVLTISGGDTAGTLDSNTNAPYVNLDQTTRRLGLFGITVPAGPIHYLSRNGESGDVIFENNQGQTFGVHVNNSNLNLTPNEMKELRVTLGATADDGLVKIVGNNPFETSKNILNVTQLGDVVIGADGIGSSGDTYGALNIASGRLFIGGSAGQDGYVLTSTGTASEWQPAPVSSPEFIAKLSDGSTGSIFGVTTPTEFEFAGGFNTDSS